jgi:hypothetical protein
MQGTQKAATGRVTTEFGTNRKPMILVDYVVKGARGALEVTYSREDHATTVCGTLCTQKGSVEMRVLSLCAGEMGLPSMPGIPQDNCGNPPSQDECGETKQEGWTQSRV